MPFKGVVVYFEYVKDDGTVVPHWAIITSLEATGFWVIENNYIDGVTAPRFVLWNDKNIKWFHDPNVPTTNEIATRN